MGIYGGGLYGGGSGGGTVATGLWSRSDLRTRIRTLAARPAADQALTDARLDEFLTEAQASWYRAIAGIVPRALYGPPVKLTTDDGGVSYGFGLDDDGDRITPMGAIELLASPTGPVLRPGGATGRDGYLADGAVLRWPEQRARLFPDGPWARFVTPPGVIDASHEPTLVPKDARILLVYRALILWAQRTNADASEWLRSEERHWTGTPAAGDTGILGALRSQYPPAGPRDLYGGSMSDGARWWRGVGSV